VRNLLLLLPFLPATVFAQQVPDSSFIPVLDAPRHVDGQGPRVKLDEGHFNFHTLSGGFTVFGRILRADGYRVSAYAERFTAEDLRSTDVLVIANALNAANAEDWSLPNPSAFDSTEIGSVKEWVLAGGSLFLIADHMPFAGAAQALGQAFGFEFHNGYALDEQHRTVERFIRGEGLEPDHPIINGVGLVQRVDTVVTFTGSAFRMPAEATALVNLTEHYTLWETRQAGEFNEDTPRINALGWSQGACRPFGRGRVVVFGEAAMFSGQLAGPQYQPVGLNRPEARGNITLLRNILAWLSEPRP